MLSRFAFSPDVVAVADAICARVGFAGWCALRPDGNLELRNLTPAGTRPRSTAVALDGQSVRGRTLPVWWSRGKAVEVSFDGVALLGSPIQVGAIRRLAGCVEVSDDGISGWAWHPGDPETPPVLIVRDRLGRPIRTITASDEIAVPETGPLSRPRSFRIERIDLANAPGLLHFTGLNGKDLPGSPLDPLADEVAHVAAAARLAQLYPASVPAPRRAVRRDDVILRADTPVPRYAIGADGKTRSPVIVVVAQDAAGDLLAWLNTVLKSVPCETRVLVVDDGVSDPDL